MTTPTEMTLFSRMKWDLRYLDSAREKAMWSKDPSSGVGAVLVDSSGEFCQGYNGFARGVKDSSDRYNDREVKYRFVVHAEANCICSAARRGSRTDGATLYVDGLLICPSCASIAVQAGVRRVVMRVWVGRDKGPWTEAFDSFSRVILQEAGVDHTIYLQDDAKIKDLEVLEDWIDGKRVLD